MNRSGDYFFEAWWAHTCENKTYKELDELGYGDVNYHNEFRQIKRYITGKFLKRNDAFRELVMNENLI